MSDAVRLHIRNNVAILTIDHPPVNALSPVIRRTIWDYLDQVEAEPTVGAIVITSLGRKFSATVEVNVLAGTRPAQSLGDLCNRIEACEKPVVAALQGAVLGGGLEVALSCHYRIAPEDGSFGFPDVQLGLSPNAGGTQRAPRLMGAGPALDLMLTGALVSSADALELGIIDEIAGGELEGNAVKLALDVREDGPRRTSEARNYLADGPTFMADVAERRASSSADDFVRTKIIACVEAALIMPFEVGLSMEAQAFRDCAQSPTAQALLYVLGAERSANRFPESAKNRPFKTVSVVGGDDLGVSVAVACLNAGLEVQIIEQGEAAVNAALDRIGPIYERLLAEGRVSEATAEAALSRLRMSMKMSDLANSEFIVEAVPEDYIVKASLLRSIEKYAKPDAVIATTTSYFDVAELGQEFGRAEGLVGLILSEKGYAERLVEVITTPDSLSITVLSARALVRGLGKIPVRVSGGGGGGVAVRLLARLQQVVDAMIEDGASPEQVDKALRGFGFAEGPYEMLDSYGLDHGRDRRVAVGNVAGRFLALGDQLCLAGAIGRKSARGYYLYDADGKRGTANPEMLRLLDAIRIQNGITTREITDREIVDQVVLALINEGAMILGEGIVQRASDIDVVMIHSLGYPRARGGPMYDADRTRPFEIAKKIKALIAKDPGLWKLAPLLERLARERGFLRDV